MHFLEIISEVTIFFFCIWMSSFVRKNVLNILDVIYLSDRCVANNFSHSLDCLFILLNLSFDEEQFFILMWFNISTVSPIISAKNMISCHKICSTSLTMNVLLR